MIFCLTFSLFIYFFFFLSTARLPGQIEDLALRLTKSQSRRRIFHKVPHSNEFIFTPISASRNALCEFIGILIELSFYVQRIILEQRRRGLVQGQFRVASFILAIRGDTFELNFTSSCLPHFSVSDNEFTNKPVRFICYFCTWKASFVFHLWVNKNLYFRSCTYQQKTILRSFQSGWKYS